MFGKMFKSKAQRKKEHNKNRLLYNGFEGLARSNKPDMAGVPRRFAQYTPLDLYQSFVPVKMDYKGQLCSGYIKRGWSLKIGLTGEFDFSFLLAEFGVGQLQPIGNIGYTRTKFSLVVVQRFPRELIFSLRDDHRPDQVATGVGHEGPQLENVTKWRIEKPIVLTTMLGRQTEKSVELGGDFQWGKTLFTVAAPGIKEDGTNDAGIGVGGNVRLAAKWESLHVVDPGPGWYESSLDSTLQQDFLDYLGPKDARDLKREIFQWLRHLTELNLKFFPNERLKGTAEKNIKKLARMPGGVDPTTGIEGLRTALKFLPPLNMLRGPLAKLEDFATKPKRLELIAELEKLKTSLRYMYENKDEHGKKLEPRLRMVFLTQTKSILDFHIHRADTYIAELKAYDNPIVAPPASADDTPPAQPTKKGAQTPAPMVADRDSKLSYVDISTSDYQANVRGGGRAILPFFAQIVTVGMGDVGVSVDGGYRKSISRFQSYCYDQSKTPLVATQDTMLTYSHIGFEANATAQFANFFYDKTLDSTSLIARARASVLNCIDYQSVVVYWPYPRSGDTVQVCRGSGIRFGCSVSLTRIKRLLSHPDAADSKRLLTGLTQGLRTDWTTLRSFFRSMDIDKTLPQKKLPPALLIEAAFPFPDGMTLKMKENGTLSNLQSDTGVLAYAKKLGRVVGLTAAKNPEVRNFKKTLGTWSGPKPETLRLRMRQADWALEETNISTDFKLGYWLVDSVPAVISLKKIEEAGREVVIDLYTHFVTNPEYNRNPIANQEKVVPPVALLHQ